MFKIVLLLDGCLYVYNSIKYCKHNLTHLSRPPLFRRNLTYHAYLRVYPFVNLLTNYTTKS